MEISELREANRKAKEEHERQVLQDLCCLFIVYMFAVPKDIQQLK